MPFEYTNNPIGLTNGEKAYFQEIQRLRLAINCLIAASDYLAAFHATYVGPMAYEKEAIDRKDQALKRKQAAEHEYAQHFGWFSEADFK